MGYYEGISVIVEKMYVKGKAYRENKNKRREKICCL